MGNYLGVMANISGSLAKQTLGARDLPVSIPDDVVRDLIRHTLNGYRAGVQAIEANPEWTQYRDATRLCEQNIGSFLNENCEGWPEIYAQFHDDPDMIKFVGRRNCCLGLLKSKRRKKRNGMMVRNLTLKAY